MKGILAAGLVCVAAALAACGGDNSNNGPQPNKPPIADVGQDITVPAAGTRIILDGSKSRDPEGTRLNYSWSITALPPKSTATLVGGNTVRPSVTLDVVGQYKFGLIVSDGELQSAEAIVTVTVQGADTTPPTDPTNPGTGTPGEVATLSLSSTSFADGGTLPDRMAATNMRGGENVSPAISVSGLPAKARYYSIVMQADCEAAEPCVLWSVFNIPASKTQITEREAIHNIPGVEFGVTNGARSYWGPVKATKYNVVLKVYATETALQVPYNPYYNQTKFEAEFMSKIIGVGKMTAKYQGSLG